MGIVYSFFRLWIKANFKTWWQRVNEYFLAVALIIDIAGNVLAQDLFNDILIKSDGYKFGDKHDTISRILGVNEKFNTLKFLGRGLANILNFIEKDHCKNSI
jgi:large-conductance mechanosensitive channel